MSTQTTNLHLVKPAYNEKADVAVINTNMDTIDTAVTNASNKADNYIYGGRIPNNSDLNDVVTPGIYFMSTSQSFLNTPAALSTLIVEKGASDISAVLQIGINTTQVWFRYRTSTTNWDAWKQITPCNGWPASGTNIDELVQPGVWGLSSTVSYTGTFPEGVNSGLLEVLGPSMAGAYNMQRLTSFYGTSVWMRYRGNNSGTTWQPWVEITAIRTPTQPTYDTTKVDSSSGTYYLTVRRVGKVVALAGGFVATASISVSTPTTIATGLPKSLTSSQGSIIGMNATKKQPVALCVTTDGKLQTYYSGETIAVGDTVRFSTTYFTNDP